MKPTTTSTGARWSITGPLNQWAAALPLPVATAVSQAQESGLAAWSEGHLDIDAAAISQWSEDVARFLGLPPKAPLGFDVRLNGSMGKPDAQIAIRWLQPGRTLPAKDAVRDGPWLDWQGQRYRLPSPMFDVIQLVDEFNRANQRELGVQFRHWAAIRECLGEANAGQLSDHFLRSLRVVSASALTFSISSDEQGDVQVDPVLLTQRRADEGEEMLSVRALTEADEVLLPKRLDQLGDGAAAFPISGGTYVVVDEPLRKALAAVRRLRRSSPEERKRAARYPEAVLRELMGEDDSAPTVFVETEHFSERVKDVGDWVPPLIPWIKVESQKWDSSVAAGVRIDGVDVPLDTPAVEEGLKSIAFAIEAKLPDAVVAGQRVPATRPNLVALKQLHHELRKREAAQSGSPAPEDDDSVVGSSQVLIIETNLDEASFQRVTVGVRPGTLRLPFGLRSTPKPHQVLGVEWLQQHWKSGSRGAMLCDDMGLGKTYQALAFCAWLRELVEEGAIERRPLLLIAPVGLLRNWEAEIAEHLQAGGLGTVLRAYGDHLKLIRRGRHAAGTASLDTSALSRADVVLANYEAVSDYQLSFGAVPFLAVILDEAQKIKSPSARMTSAVKGLNTEFLVAMTGTPVENRLADLWCLADAVQPGVLDDLKQFSAVYEVPGADVVALRKQVWQEDDREAIRMPRLLLRRLKSDKLEGLPPKHEHVLKVQMPPRQLEAYQRVLALKELSGPKGTLGMIQNLRRVSLHPLLIEGGADMNELRPQESARFIGALQALDQVHQAGEKALVFLESLDLQDADQLPLLLQRRYGLRQLPMVINGQVSSEQRQARVNTFQRDAGFDVMLLSPKAGGVGLTLTAANHVIHLSRWWNPAVEDQCSDRVYRIGQTKPVHIYYPLAVLPHAEESSFDLQLQMLMDRKRKLAQNLLAAPAFSKEDYEAILAGSMRQVVL